MALHFSGLVRRNQRLVSLFTATSRFWNSPKYFAPVSCSINTICAKKYLGFPQNIASGQAHGKHFRRLSSVIPQHKRDASTDLKSVLARKIPQEQKRIKDFRKKYGNAKVCDVTVNMIYGGMREIKAILCETSLLDAHEGIRFRGLTIPECQKLLPKGPDGSQPLPEGVFWLLLTGEVPTAEQAAAVSKDWAARSKLPDHVETMLCNLPPFIHPMTQLSAAVNILNSESVFNNAYMSGEPRSTFWEYVYEDSMNLLGKLPVIAATIYRNCFKKRSPIGEYDPCKDWSYNFAHMLGYDVPQFVDLMRLYLTIHCDHEGGNVSAHTTHLVGSALSDPYLSLAAGLNGLAGPLHGRANQEVLTWIRKLRKEVGDDMTEDQIRKFITKTLTSGRVIPGYGHAVLRKTDPRYICQCEFANKHLPNDPYVQLSNKLYKVIPEVLSKLGKVSNPWPNVDAYSGVLLQHYGLTEMRYYTVLFGVSRAIGVMASLVWDRALGLPLERPKSVTTDELMKLVGADTAG